MRLRDQLRRLRREASQDVVLICQRDGSVKAFDEMTVAKHLFIAQFNRAGGQPNPPGPVADALANATRAERERIEAMGRCAAFAFLDDPDFELPDEIPDLSE